MTSVPRYVTFQSEAFNTTVSKDYFFNPECYGDDLAQWLMEQLRAAGIQTDAEPEPEDYGWFFDFRVGETNYQFILGYRPADAEVPAVWIGWIEPNAGLVASLFGARKHAISPDAVLAIHNVLAASSQIHHIRWHQQADFEAGQEEKGVPEPFW